jgi:hypothetical protein
MSVDTCTPEPFNTRAELLAIVYSLNKFRVYIFDRDYFNPEIVNKYCCIQVPSRDAIFTNREMDLNGFLTDYCFHLTQGWHPLCIRIHTHIYISKLQ